MRATFLVISPRKTQSAHKTRYQRPIALQRERDRRRSDLGDAEPSKRGRRPPLEGHGHTSVDGWSLGGYAEEFLNGRVEDTGEGQSHVEGRRPPARLDS
jgi:hypothetical protein